MGDEKIQFHHQIDLLDAPYQKLGKDEFIESPYVREKPNCRVDQTHASNTTNRQFRVKWVNTMRLSREKELSDEYQLRYVEDRLLDPGQNGLQG
jgi:hypothetical protein